MVGIKVYCDSSYIVGSGGMLANLYVLVYASCTRAIPAVQNNNMSPPTLTLSLSIL